MKNRAGLLFGTFLGLWHAGWCAIVAVGLGQRLLDFVFWLHFLAVPVQVQPFSAPRAFGLVAFTFAVGYALGWLFFAAWEACRRPSA